MNSNPTTNLIYLLFLIICNQSNSQNTLDKYVEYGLENNLVLKQKNISIEKGFLSLREANALFLPSINFNANYLSGEGGRTFDVPLGDLLNPVYSTLNNLTSSNTFPQLTNNKFTINPNNYYDAHFRVSLPLINTDIIYNKKIQKQQSSITSNELEIYKRELVYNIKTSYFNYLMAKSTVEIYESALVLVEKNLKITQSLFKNGSGLKANVNRAKAEFEQVNAEIIDSKGQLNQAKYYFNFLLNKDLESEILTNKEDYDKIDKVGIVNKGANIREELNLLKTQIGTLNTLYKLNKSYWIPKISAFADLGSQATNFKYNSDSKYYFVGIQMDFPFFNGFKNSIKIKQSKLDISNSLLYKDILTKQLEMSTKIAKNLIESTYEEFQSSESRYIASYAYYVIIEQGYIQGANSLLEFIDSRNQFTSSMLQSSIAKYKYLQAVSNLERENATFELQKK